MRRAGADLDLSVWANTDEPAIARQPTGEVFEFTRLPRHACDFDTIMAEKALAAVAGTKGIAIRGRRPFPHPFPARMPLEVARAAIVQFSQPGDTILDPMCGSGVVARAAQLEGRNAIARDLDPLAVYLSQALCAVASPKIFRTLSDEVLARALMLAEKSNFLADKLSNLPAEDQAFVRYWFKERAAKELFAIAEILDDLAPTPARLFAALTFSAGIISRSGGASMAMDLPRSRPHRILTRTPKLPFELWRRNSINVERYLEGKKNEQVRVVDACLGDARNLDLVDESVDVVITSPPYINAIDYLRTSKFTLVFFGHKLIDLRAIRSSSVGTERGLAVGKLPETLEALVNDRVADERRKPLLRRYVYDMLSVLLETARVLKPGGQALYVVGPSILSRREYDGAHVLAEIARVAGLKVMGHDRRDLSSANRSLPPPNRNLRSASIHRRMTCELYVALRKASK